MLEVLKRAADDINFYSQLAEDPQTALKGFDLTLEEKTAFLSGDLQFIEFIIGRKLDGRLLSQERSILSLLLRRRRGLKKQGRLIMKNKLAIGLATALVILVIVATTLGIMLSSANSELSSARTQLSNSQANLASTQAQLSSIEKQLSSAQPQLSSIEAQLSSIEKQLSSTQGQLSSTQTELSNTKNQLAYTQAQLSKAQQEAAAVPNEPSPAPTIINKNAIPQIPGAIATGSPQMVITATIINNGGPGQVTVTATMISGLYSLDLNQSKSISLYLAHRQQQEVTFIFTLPHPTDEGTYTVSVN